MKNSQKNFHQRIYMKHMLTESVSAICDADNADWLLYPHYLCIIKYLI